MTCLLYQCWNGPMPSAAEYSLELMRDYAVRMGAHYRCDIDDRYMGKHSKYFDMLRPVYDEDFHEYDKVCVVDMDVFPVDGLTENIFDEPVGDFGMCEEPDQPWMREVPHVPHITHGHDEEWAALFSQTKFPRDEQGRLRVFNSGVALFSREGLCKGPEAFWDIDYYTKRTSHLPSFYQWDQMFLHAMAFSQFVDFTVLPQEWNRQIHHLPDGSIYDKRTADTKFVHIQLRGANNFSREQIREVVHP